MARTITSSLESRLWRSNAREFGAQALVLFAAAGTFRYFLNPTLQANCQMVGDLCKQTLAQIGQAFDNLWAEMADDGVQDIVYVQYADNVGTFSPTLREDVGTPSICFSDGVRCHFVDTTAAVMSQVAADGVHPIQAANERIATLVYHLMVQDGMRR